MAKTTEVVRQFAIFFAFFLMRNGKKKVEEEKDFTITEETTGSKSCYNYLQ